LSEAPVLEAERLAALIGKLLPESQLRILPLPQSKAIFAKLLESRPLPRLLELPLVDTVSPLGLEMKRSQINPRSVFYDAVMFPSNSKEHPHFACNALVLIFRHYARPLAIMHRITPCCATLRPNCRKISGSLGRGWRQSRAFWGRPRSTAPD